MCFFSDKNFCLTSKQSNKHTLYQPRVVSKDPLYGSITSKISRGSVACLHHGIHSPSNDLVIQQGLVAWVHHDHDFIGLSYVPSSRT